MRGVSKKSYSFGPFQLITDQRQLLRNGGIVALTPKVFDTLVMLVESSGRLLEREELLKAVWHDSFVEESNLTVSISTLRKALGEQPDGRQYIETVPKRGYRFVADVREVEDELFILRERTRSEIILEQESGAGDQTEGGAEASQAKTRTRRRFILLLAGCLALVVLSLALGYWWKAKQANAQGIRSIAVLPFNLLGADENDEYLTMGLADVLITRLGSLNRIVLRPTSAVFKYTDAEQDAVTAGKELKVDAVLEGSIQKAGGRLRVTARLVRVRDGELMWAETFDGKLADPFVVQDEMSERLAVALALNPAVDEKRLLTRRYTESTEAYQAYARGRYLWNKRDPGSLKKAIEYFEGAIKIDGDYALAYAGLADCYSLLVNYVQIPQDDGFPKARVAAQRALEIDDLLAEPHASLAKILQLYDLNWEEAEKEFRRAIELNPNYATAHQWYGEYLISMGRFDEAKAEMKLALELDPVSPAINLAQGFPYYYNREYDEAIAAYKKALDLDPTFEATHARLFAAYCRKRMYDEAIAEFLAVYVNYPQVQEGVKTVYAASGMSGFWKGGLPPSQQEKHKWQIARAYANLNNKEEALIWLEKAFDARDHDLILLKVDPEFDILRSEPRFQELLRRMRLAP